MLHLTKGVGSLQSIGSNIRAFRLQNGFTQEQLAEKLGVTFQAVSKWETNANTPDIISEGAINGDVTSHGSIECPVINSVGDVIADGDILAYEINAAGKIICKQLQGRCDLKCNSTEYSDDS